MPDIFVKKTGRVTEKVWDVDDTYMTVEVQVFDEEGFKPGDEVELVIRKKTL